jgi:hypothetical protein
MLAARVSWICCEFQTPSIKQSFSILGLVTSPATELIPPRSSHLLQRRPGYLAAGGVHRGTDGAESRRMQSPTRHGAIMTYIILAWRDRPARPLCYSEPFIRDMHVDQNRNSSNHLLGRWPEEFVKGRFPFDMLANSSKLQKTRTQVAEPPTPPPE